VSRLSRFIDLLRFYPVTVCDSARITRRLITVFIHYSSIRQAEVGAARTLILGMSLTKPIQRAPMQFSPPPPAPPELPPPPKVSELEPALQDAIRDLCKTFPDVGGEVTPKLYRHFGIWPRFMMVVANRLASRLVELDWATYAMSEACEPLLLDLAQRARARSDGPPLTTDMSQLINVLDGFGYVIPHFIVVGRAVDAALSR
jgi:hypothetical protein